MNYKVHVPCIGKNRTQHMLYSKSIQIPAMQHLNTDAKYLRENDIPIEIDVIL